ncbi:uncharacterized protein METZ01_LOCUS415519, partial [marine metagenome]
MSDYFPLFPEQASTFAAKVDGLFLLLVCLSVFFAVGVVFFIILFSVKYRRRSEDERPKPIEGSLPLELAWSIIPLILSLVVFSLGAGLAFRM